MKHIIAGMLLAVMLLTLTACGGNVKNVEIAPYSSQVYSDAEIEAAITTVLGCFSGSFSGCTLTELSYVGDSSLESYQEFADRNQADEVIVFTSTFDVDKSGGDGSLSPNTTYRYWNWILVRERNGEWVLVDYGY